MNTEKAILLSIGEVSGSLITEYQLGLIVYILYRNKKYQGKELNLKKESATKRELSSYLKRMVDLGILKTHPNFKFKVYEILGRKSENLEESVCAIDPFCYLSHFSAMEYHGLTERIPTKIFISSPSVKDWGEYASQKMKKDLEDEFEQYVKNGMPILRKPRMTRVYKKEINNFSSMHHGAFVRVRDSNLRVSSVGRTFLDMLRQPDLCGGIRHVIGVYNEFADSYLDLIIDEFNRHGKPIDKVRAGYILEEMEVEDRRVGRWSKLAQRGGSRKLDAAGEYLPEWSEKWKISLNVI